MRMLFIGCQILPILLCISRVESTYTCQPSYKASWFPYPPYSNEDESISVLHKMTRTLVQICCGFDTQVDFIKRWSNGVEMQADDTNDDTFSFPVSINIHEIGARRRVPGFDFLPVIISPGAFYLTSDEKSEGSQILDVLKETWPLLIVMFCGSTFAGIVIWMCDSRPNPDQFPRAFLPGLFEGVWWAFVSMTTVGYGDKTPSSFVARLFGMAWILVGICYMSVFTSIVTAAFTTAQAPLSSISFKRVGVLNGSEDFIIAFSQNAKVHVCNNRTCLKDMLRRHDTIDGVLLDHFVAVYMEPQDGADGDSENFLHKVSVEWKTDIPIAHGIHVKDVPAELEDCFMRTVVKKRYYAYRDLLSILELEEREAETAGSVAQDIIFTGSDGFLKFAIGIGVFCAVLLICIGVLTLIDVKLLRGKVEDKPTELKENGVEDRSPSTNRDSVGVETPV